MKVSIIVTAYNVAAYVEQALESCLTQTHRDLEIIVVEDASTDRTAERVADMARKDSRLRVIRNAENVGAGASRRIGLRAATGEYTLLLDGDDYLDATFVAALVAGAEATGADIVSGGITVLHPDGAWDKTCYGDTVTEGMEKVTKFWGERVVFMNNKLIRRTLHERVPYCERRFVEDTPTIIPQLYLANRVAYVSHTGYHYRMNPESLTHRATPFKYCLFRLLCAADLIRFFEEHDKSYLQTLPLGMTYAGLIQEMKRLNPTPEMIAPYRDEWIAFTTEMLRRIS